MYNKDPQLRCAGEQIEYTREMLEEYIKCKEDVIYFAEHYFRIISEKGEHLIELREYQKRMIRAMVGGDGDPRPYIACVAARQIGKCCNYDTNIKIRNKKTGEVIELSIGDFYRKIFTVFSKLT